MAGSGGGMCVEPLKKLSNHSDLTAIRQSASRDPWKWDDRHVRMPCSSQNGGSRGESGWQQISSALGRTFYRGGYELGEVIKSYNAKHAGGWMFQGLEEFSNKNGELFSKVVPEIIHMALELPKVITQPIPILKAGQEGSVTLSQTQLASLLANAFLCTFPWRNEPSQSQTLPSINFSNLFAQRDASAVEKIKCIFHYFEKVSLKMPDGKVTFTRRVLNREPDWRNSTRKLLSLDPTDRGSIEEDGRGMLQVDFANKVIGGGVLGRGAVQEEIRFVLSPELIVSRLFTEELQHKEALVITGSERFSAYSGYAQSFRYAGDFEDKTPYDGDGRRRCSIVAIDAIHFRNSDDQHKKHYIDRELNKAYAGFHLEGADRNQLSPVATGNWGCGAFNGDPQLKTLLQWLAASEAGRSLHYFTYGDKALADNTREMKHLLDAFQIVTVGQLYQQLVSLPSHRPGGVFAALLKAVDTKSNEPSGRQDPPPSWQQGSSGPNYSGQNMGWSTTNQVPQNQAQRVLHTGRHPVSGSPMESSTTQRSVPPASNADMNQRGPTTAGPPLSSSQVEAGSTGRQQLKIQKGQDFGKIHASPESTQAEPSLIDKTDPQQTTEAHAILNPTHVAPPRTSSMGQNVANKVNQFSSKSTKSSKPCSYADVAKSFEVNKNRAKGSSVFSQEETTNSAPEKELLKRKIQ